MRSLTELSAPLCFLALSVAAPLSAETFSADVWADNWFQMTVNGEVVATDSVPITTERSFNAESFTFEAETPFVIGITGMDFRENDTGLEYIGTNRQQMGDGGVIAQIRNGAGETVAVTDGDWQCFVTHFAPVDTACADEANPMAGEGVCAFEITETPEGWDTPDFDAADWPAADVFSADQVDPKMGYDDVTWVPSAEFIWGPDLHQVNTVLCRTIVE